MAELAIETHGLVKTYGETRAVDGIDLAIARGGVHGFLGPNGAGKTTAIRMLATLIRPDAGSASVLGYDIGRQADEVRSRVALTGQFASVDEDLTGMENLRLIAKPVRVHAEGRLASCAGSPRRLRPGVRGGQAGQEVLGRHAPAHRHRGVDSGHAGTAVPRRADHRSRPT
ncbi:hypothetical protein GCM10025876_07090 [Demequina litorisediminis]|uniref:ABC transporter domain-containing protein n=1 Tax=Demequina litorisediminis TaxID=1849022 RepID=A0ABQ6I9U6_9MICO|nr:hypothetical protein GCM10025876_07090 [Demequina litorisediminis]